MATGSGTGTAISSSSSATLATLRARVRVMVENASGFPEPLIVSGSTETLTTLRDRVETVLQDSTNAKWATGDVDESIERAIEMYSRRNPDHALGTIALAADGREISLSTLTGLLQVEKVWWDYDSGTPGYPPNWRQFDVFPGKILYIDDPIAPSNGDTVRVWYTKVQALNGLNSATATTIPGEDITYIIDGAAGLALQSRAVELSEGLNVDDKVVMRLENLAKALTKNFRYGMNRRPPAWQRYAYAVSQDDIDEAIRWALHRYTEVMPNRAIGTITLSSAGREVSLASLTSYIEVERVWWDYDSSDSAYPPQWRDFEVWPGDILYIDDGDEPASGDVVRIWYTKMQTLNGLDGAAVTSLPFDAETMICIGASGYALQERVQESEGSRIPTRLREWADLRRKEFEVGLKRLARHAGVRASGVARAPALDRWDDGGW